MSTRFEILKNGKRICISGINGDGVLSVGLSDVKRAGEESTHDLFDRLTECLFDLRKI